LIGLDLAIKNSFNIENQSDRKKVLDNTNLSMLLNLGESKIKAKET
jgi:hypothetical protein